MSEPKAEPNTPRCPVCGKSQATTCRPFCSDRCAKIDLSRWLKGSYAIPARDDDEDVPFGGTGGGEQA